MSGFMCRESLPFGSYTRTLRGKVLEPMSRSSHDVCSGRCHSTGAAGTALSGGWPQRGAACCTRHTRVGQAGGDGSLRASRAPPTQAGHHATALDPAPPRRSGEPQPTCSPPSTPLLLPESRLSLVVFFFNFFFFVLETR